MLRLQKGWHSLGRGLSFLKSLIRTCSVSVLLSVRDPGFPRRGRQPLTVGPKKLLGKIFAENCMKMKEFAPKGDATPPPWIRQSHLDAYFTRAQSKHCSRHYFPLLTL